MKSIDENLFMLGYYEDIWKIARLEIPHVAVSAAIETHRLRATAK